jgi:multiple sugar transport system permease protein
MSEQAFAVHPAPLQASRWRRWWNRNKDTADGYLFLIPFLAVYVIFVIYPVIQAVYMSLYDWDLLAMDVREFIRLKNYVQMAWGANITWNLQHLLVWRLLGLATIPLIWWVALRGSMPRATAAWLSVIAVVFFAGMMGIHPGEEGGRWYDAIFWASLGNTVKFVVLSTPLIVAVGLVMALALNGSGRSLGLFRTAFFASYVFSVAVLTLIWGYLFQPQRGILAAFLSNLGVEPIPWLTDPNLAMPAIVVATLWWTVGFNMVLFLAGLQDIDPTLYEAAEIDGAGRWAQFRNITLPGLQRTTLLVVVLQIIASFQIFGQVYIMTRGGPAGSTRVLIQHIYESGFRDFKLGYASAMSIFLFAIMFVVSFFQFRLSPEEE